MTTLSRITQPETAATERQLYTVDQARRALVLVERIVDDILATYQELVELEGDIELAECIGDDRAIDTGRRELVGAIDRLQDCLEELEQLGVEMRDFKRGVVEFPSLDRGRAICLLWTKGETTINYWHHRGQSAEDRRHVDELQQRLFQFV